VIRPPPDGWSTTHPGAVTGEPTRGEEDAVGDADADELDVAAEEDAAGAVPTDVHDLRDAVGDADADEIDVAADDAVGSADLHGSALGDDVAGCEGPEPHAATTISRAKGSLGRRAARALRAGGASPLG
jgi:hypothetical protein